MEIRCTEMYDEAMAHAATTEDKSLQNCLDRLKSWEKNRDCEIILYYDRAPLSFYFEMKDKSGQRIMNGGLLYHGNPDRSFAVTLEPTIGWQIHT
jgi:hypothetical protein